LGITAITISPLRRFLAVAERGERPICYIYDTLNQRRKKRLICADCQSNEFVSLNFAQGQESRIMLTLGGAPD